MIPDLTKFQEYLNNPNSSLPKLVNSIGFDLKDAGTAVRAGGIKFTWHLPTKTDLGLPAEFYTSRGFNPRIYNNVVWTIDESGASQVIPGGVAKYMALDSYPITNAVFYANCSLKVFFV